MRLAERAAGRAAVLRIAEDRAPADAARSADDAVALFRLVSECGRADCRPDDVQGAWVAHQLEALERGQDLRLLAGRSRKRQRGRSPSPSVEGFAHVSVTLGDPVA